MAHRGRAAIRPRLEEGCRAFLHSAQRFGGQTAAAAGVLLFDTVTRRGFPCPTEHWKDTITVTTDDGRLRIAMKVPGVDADGNEIGGVPTVLPADAASLISAAAASNVLQ
jgi:hypothetical protein